MLEFLSAQWPISPFNFSRRATSGGCAGSRFTSSWLLAWGTDEKHCTIPKRVSSLWLVQTGSSQTGLSATEEESSTCPEVIHPKDMSGQEPSVMELQDINPWISMSRLRKKADRTTKIRRIPIHSGPHKSGPHQYRYTSSKLLLTNQRCHQLAIRGGH